LNKQKKSCGLTPFLQLMSNPAVHTTGTHHEKYMKR
jgi:hypothetical protein